MTELTKLPVTIVTGFLGSGKTTLIRHLMQNSCGKRLAVIVNEFGDVGVDVLGGLLTADTKTLHQVLSGQPTFPPGDRLDQTVAKGKIPANGFGGGAAFHGVLTCLKS